MESPPRSCLTLAQTIPPLTFTLRSWLNRRVCLMDLSDVSRRRGVRVDGFIGADVLSEFSAVRIDYGRSVVEFGIWHPDEFIYAAGKL